MKGKSCCGSNPKPSGTFTTVIRAALKSTRESYQGQVALLGVELAEKQKHGALLEV